MTSQVLNFLWLNLDLPAPKDPEDGSIRQPLPEKYIENLRNAAKAHPSAEIDFWVDSKRLTEKQMTYLKQVVEDGLSNVHLRDLRSLPAYDKEKLYNKTEKSSDWRNDQRTVIWRQVDAAKILISLQGNFDQTFFADFDKSHLDIESQEVQERLKKHGMFIGSYGENQLWGLNETRRQFFEEYYTEALKVAYKGDNAWDTLCKKARSQLADKEKIPYDEIYIILENEGPRASQPGHSWNGTNGWGEPKESTPAVIPADKISAIFNASSRKGTNANISAIFNTSSNDNGQGVHKSKFHCVPILGAKLQKKQRHNL